MDKMKFDLLEVRPKNKGCYRVTVYKYDTGKYFQAKLNFDGNSWDYGDLENCYVCFISEVMNE